MTASSVPERSVNGHHRQVNHWSQTWKTDMAARIWRSLRCIPASHTRLGFSGKTPCSPRCKKPKEVMQLLDMKIPLLPKGHEVATCCNVSVLAPCVSFQWRVKPASRPVYQQLHLHRGFKSSGVKLKCVLPETKYKFWATFYSKTAFSQTLKMWKVFKTTPCSATEVRAFLGLCSYYKFITNFAHQCFTACTYWKECTLLLVFSMSGGIHLHETCTLTPSSGFIPRFHITILLLHRCFRLCYWCCPWLRDSTERLLIS